MMSVRDEAIKAMSQHMADLFVLGDPKVRDAFDVPMEAALDALVGWLRDNLLDLADAAQNTKNGSVLTEAGWAFTIATLVELLEGKEGT